MFQPKTERIAELAKNNPEVIKRLKEVFDKKTNIYIDDANVVHWVEKLQWHVDYKRLKQFLDSFGTINSIKIYKGTLQGNKFSEESIRDLRKWKFDLTTKPVKVMRLSMMSLA
jgi:hypothetical protein